MSEIMKWSEIPSGKRKVLIWVRTNLRKRKEAAIFQEEKSHDKSTKE